ncbi:hypothetical protein [Bacillus infantis]|uniref:hypothetical protein n=1 Tax=Bacillus infantis TaxID=324767 RepID=UPI003CEC3E23
MIDIVVDHDGCKGCKYECSPMDSKHCTGCKQNATDKYTPMTRGDRIRAMSDEELAHHICDCFDCLYCPFGYVDDIYYEAQCKCKEGEEIEHLVNWLKEGVSDE